MSPSALAVIISDGALMNTAPGRPDSAVRKAFATTSEIESGEQISVLSLVIGRNRLTVSMLWCRSFSRIELGILPPIATTGSPSDVAVARPVTMFEQPGPDVTNTTPAFDVMRPIPDAMNAGFCSWRRSLVLVLETSKVLEDFCVF